MVGRHVRHNIKCVHNVAADLPELFVSWTGFLGTHKEAARESLYNLSLSARLWVHREVTHMVHL